MKLGREVSRHNELDNWRSTHRFESVMATKWLSLTISETEPGLWDRLTSLHNSQPLLAGQAQDSQFMVDSLREVQGKGLNVEPLAWRF